MQIAIPNHKQLLQLTSDWTFTTDVTNYGLRQAFAGAGNSWSRSDPITLPKGTVVSIQSIRTGPQRPHGGSITFRIKASPFDAISPVRQGGTASYGMTFDVRPGELNDLEVEPFQGTLRR